jgi:hypothetical protein
VYNSLRDSGPAGSNSSELFRGLSGGRGSVGMAWRAHADDEEFDEARVVAAGLRFKEVSRSEAARKSTCRGDPRWNRPNVERDFLNARVRIIAASFRSNSGSECSAFPGISFPNVPA